MMINLPKSLTTVTPLSKILAGVLFITLPFLGFYMGMEYEKAITQDFTEPPTPIVRTTPKPATDPTANWKTYTANGYSFQYPKDWEVKEDSKNLNPTGIAYVSVVSPEYIQYDMYNKNHLLSPYAGGIIEVYSEYKRPEETIEDLTKRLPIDIGLKDSLMQNKDSKAGYSGTSYTNVAKLQGVGSSDQQGFWFITKIKNYDIAIDIRLTISNDKVIDEETKNSYRDVYEYFLSTFKLIDQKPNVDNEAAEFIKNLCNSGGEKYHYGTTEKFSPKVFKCGEYYSIYPGRFIMDAPIIMVDKSGKAVSSCGGMPVPDGFEPNPICDDISCDQNNLCKGVEINCEGITTDYAYESCLCENYMRTGREGYLRKITKTDFKDRCSAFKEVEDRL